jgi:carbohydrate-binding DOMON domain-containing protein
MSANEEDIKPDPVNSQPDLSSPNDKRTKPTTGSNTEHSHETENKTKTKTTTKTATKTTTKAKTSLSTGGSNGKWTPEKRERLIEMLLAAGIKAFNVLRFRLRP